MKCASEEALKICANQWKKPPEPERTQKKQDFVEPNTCLKKEATKPSRPFTAPARTQCQRERYTCNEDETFYPGGFSCRGIMERERE
jgi:hypothetical protein